MLNDNKFQLKIILDLDICECLWHKLCVWKKKTSKRAVTIFKQINQFIQIYCQSSIHSAHFSFNLLTVSLHRYDLKIHQVQSIFVWSLPVHIWEHENRNASVYGISAKYCYKIALNWAVNAISLSHFYSCYCVRKK